MQWNDSILPDLISTQLGRAPWLSEIILQMLPEAPYSLEGSLTMQWNVLNLLVQNRSTATHCPVWMTTYNGHHCGEVTSARIICNYRLSQWLMSVMANYCHYQQVTVKLPRWFTPLMLLTSQQMPLTFVGDTERKQWTIVNVSTSNRINMYNFVTGNIQACVSWSMTINNCWQRRSINS